MVLSGREYDHFDFQLIHSENVENFKYLIKEHK